MVEPILPVHQAAKDGDIAALRKTSKRELHRVDFDGWTAAHWCAWRGNSEALEVVLSRG